MLRDIYKYNMQYIEEYIHLHSKFSNQSNQGQSIIEEVNDTTTIDW